MRRHEKNIAEKSSLRDIIKQAKVCRIGLSDGYRPYIVPLSFGYEKDCLYFHGAHEGKKIELLRKNNSVCFEFDVNTEIVTAHEACQWGMRYQSIIGFGTATFIEDTTEKRQALDIIMRQYAEGSFTFPDQAVNDTTVIRVKIESMTGKQSGF
jgi:nitroimidazol reductase NimA-like FMN-containing flavoprotein (pyridoxamine 5'-phosphate oxidase superfamily)